MDTINLAEAALSAAPPPISRAAAFALEIGPWAGDAWSTSGVAGVVNHRIDAVMRALQDSMSDSLAATPPLAPANG